MTPFMDDAACLGEEPELWFAEGKSANDRIDRDLAIAICQTCPARQICLDDALAQEGGTSGGQRFGIRGGLTPSQRARLRPRAGILAPCGTPGAARRHRRHGEDPCPECHAAESVYWRQRKGRVA